MPASDANVSPEHFAWLVDGRSANQLATLELYKIIHEGERKLNSNVEMQEAAQILTGVAFSLWRAVFLSDTTGEYAEQMADVRKFLISLISDNTGLYVTDKNSRNWSFRYYLKNAVYGLQELSQGNLSLVEEADLKRPAESDKDDWLDTQTIFDKAVKRFETAVRGSP